MYKEFRDLTRADAVKSLYQDMAARHRARFRSIHVCRPPSFICCGADVYTDSPRSGD